MGRAAASAPISRKETNERRAKFGGEHGTDDRGSDEKDDRFTFFADEIHVPYAQASRFVTS